MARPIVLTEPKRTPMFQPAIPIPAWWAPNGFAAIPTAALDPPHSAASPAVPALDKGPGPHFRFARKFTRSETFLRQHVRRRACATRTKC